MSETGTPLVDVNLTPQADDWLAVKIAEMNARIQARNQADEVRRLEQERQSKEKLLCLQREHRQRVAYVEQLRVARRRSQI